MPQQRTDEKGRAHKGSQLQIQIYVNRRADELSRAIVQATPELSNDSVRLQWVSPLEQDGFAEYQDESFLQALGLAKHTSSLRAFWPKRGPSWDALGTLDFPGRKFEKNVLLVEAKSHIAEVYGSGCQAKEPARIQIRNSLAPAKQWCGASEDADWLGQLYQSANRLAHVYFFRKLLDLPAWLVQIYFCDDPHVPTSAAEWDLALPRIKQALGLPEHPLPYLLDVKLPARSRSELTGTVDVR